MVLTKTGVNQRRQKSKLVVPTLITHPPTPSCISTTHTAQPQQASDSKHMFKCTTITTTKKGKSEKLLIKQK